ncbi:hypothetical protein HDU96_007841 [Phlyctochytrium bullatum]|nr:hypothetical protein HDU96_007841 [Phlyctochytrium bullatum]
MSRGTFASSKFPLKPKRHKTSKLSTTVIHSPNRGLVMHRDANSAKNMRNIGLRYMQNGGARLAWNLDLGWNPPLAPAQVWNAEFAWGQMTATKTAGRCFHAPQDHRYETVSSDQHAKSSKDEAKIVSLESRISALSDPPNAKRRIHRCVCVSFKFLFVIVLIIVATIVIGVLAFQNRPSASSTVASHDNDGGKSVVSAQFGFESITNFQSIPKAIPQSVSLEPKPFSEPVLPVPEIKRKLQSNASSVTSMKPIADLSNGQLLTDVSATQTSTESAGAVDAEASPAPSPKINQTVLIAAGCGVAGTVAALVSAALIMRYRGRNALASSGKVTASSEAAGIGLAGGRQGGNGASGERSGPSVSEAPRERSQPNVASTVAASHGEFLVANSGPTSPSFVSSAGHQAFGTLGNPNQQAFIPPTGNSNHQAFGTLSGQPNHLAAGTLAVQPNQHAFSTPAGHPNHQAFGTLSGQPNHLEAGTLAIQPNQQAFSTPTGHPNHQAFDTLTGHNHHNTLAQPAQHTSAQGRFDPLVPFPSAVLTTVPTPVPIQAHYPTAPQQPEQPQHPGMVTATVPVASLTLNERDRVGAAQALAIAPSEGERTAPSEQSSRVAPSNVSSSVQTQVQSEQSGLFGFLQNGRMGVVSPSIPQTPCLIYGQAIGNGGADVMQQQQQPRQEDVKVLFDQRDVQDFETKPLASWSVVDVGAWMDKVGVKSQIISVFASNGITGSSLLILTANTLAQMGIKNPETQSLILGARDALIKREAERVMASHVGNMENASSRRTNHSPPVATTTFFGPAIPPMPTSPIASLRREDGMEPTPPDTLPRYRVHESMGNA